jgi:hypothetical protein
MEGPDPSRDPRVIVTFVLALVTALVLAMSSANGGPAAAQTTAPTLLDAALGHLDAGTPTEPVDEALEALVADAIGVRALAHGVLTVVAGGDPISIEPFLACHLRRERAHWAEVGPAWARARAGLGDDLERCDLAEDSPCGLELRLRVQTAAGLDLAALPECDGACALRLEQVRQRLAGTARAFEELGRTTVGPDVDVVELLRAAERTLEALEERIRTAEPSGAGPDVCEPDTPDAPVPSDRSDTTRSITPAREVGVRVGGGR